MATPTLPYTLAEALTEVRAIIREPTEILWTDTELNNFIKEGCVDITAKTLCYKKVAELDENITADIIEYIVPSLAFKILSVEFKDGAASPNTYRGLIRIHPRQIEHDGSSGAGDPRYWYHYADRIGIYPVPASLDSSDRLSAHYALTSETITDLPDRYQQFAVNYAAAMALFKRRKNRAAVSLYSGYLNSVKFSRMDIENLEAVETKDQLQIPDFTVRGR